jgi:putative ubiquitin-RnfH superfamily antitoxin RatB of RatAB toxin-antitoxin module
MAREETISIEVVYALSAEQVVVCLSVPVGSTVRHAVEVSGLTVRFPECAHAPVGIYGRVVDRDALLRDGDRVEIYRKLVADPKQARRRRAARGL